jgi:hypothetical protein
MTDWAAGLPRPVAFVLSGGASLGAIQVGMLQALVDVSLPPDLLVGTSVGSLNGVVVAEDETLGTLLPSSSTPGRGSDAGRCSPPGRVGRASRCRARASCRNSVVPGAGLRASSCSTPATCVTLMLTPA